MKYGWSNEFGMGDGRETSFREKGWMDGWRSVWALVEWPAKKLRFWVALSLKRGLL